MQIKEEKLLSKIEIIVNLCNDINLYLTNPFIFK